MCFNQFNQLHIPEPTASPPKPLNFSIKLVVNGERVCLSSSINDSHLV